MRHVAKSPSRWRRLFTALERSLKVGAFDCSMCGQCILRSTGLVCPMRCPKQMRNGPCGGSTNGQCEVYPDKPCVWRLIYERARRLGMTDKLSEIQPAPDWSLWGTSALLNLAEGKIDRHGHAKVPSPGQQPFPRASGGPASGAAEEGPPCCMPCEPIRLLPRRAEVLRRLTKRGTRNRHAVRPVRREPN